MALVASIHEGCSRNFSGDPLHLVKLAVQGVAVEWIAGAGLDAYHEAFLVGYGQAHLYPEFVGLVRLSLRNTLHLGCSRFPVEGLRAWSSYWARQK